MTRTLGFSVLLLGCLVLALCGTPRAAARAAARSERAENAAARALDAGAQRVLRLGAGSGAARAVDPRFRAPLAETRSCKPRAPIELHLQQTGARDGSVVDLQWEVTPHASVGAVRWELRLPEGAELLDGERQGELAAGAAGTGLRQARVRLPPAADFSRVSLVADSRLDEAAAPAGSADRVESRLSLGWGTPPSAGPLRRLVEASRSRRDPGRGIAAVPATHRSGR